MTDAIPIRPVAKGESREGYVEDFVVRIDRRDFALMTNDATINALVAEHLLGIKPEPYRWLDDESRKVAWWYPSLPGYPDGYWHREPPDACNDGNAMLRVIEAMRARQCEVTIEAGEDEFDVIVTQWEITEHSAKEVAQFDATDAVAPRAVAFAALRALGIEVPA